MALADAYGAFAIIGVVLTAILTSEAVAWVLVYRKPEYKRVCERVRSLSKKRTYLFIHISISYIFFLWKSNMYVYIIYGSGEGGLAGAHDIG